MTYVSKRDETYTKKLRTLVKELPEFCGVFFRGVESTTSALTRYGYAVDFRTFFTFLVNKNEIFKGKSVEAITLNELKTITAMDIELFLEHIAYYTKDELKLENHDKAKARKLSSLRSLFKYLFKRELIDKNVAALVDAPKTREKPILRLEANEVANLLDAVDSGETLSPTQKRYHKVTKARDAALFALFLGTGIRISELVGLNNDDFDFDTNGFKVTRKGGESMILYFGNEVASALKSYLNRRGELSPLPGHENAMFLSMQGKRISLRAVQNLVKKYTNAVVPLKNITPHKLRSTYGTMLYQETGDIYLVADVLGHKDVNTTRKHYAELTDERRRQAAKAVILRDD